MVFVAVVSIALWLENSERKTHLLSLATRIAGDIAQDEELTHTYISLTWRECFSEIDKKLNG
jgi:hypothetical protein